MTQDAPPPEPTQADPPASTTSARLRADAGRAFSAATGHVRAYVRNNRARLWPLVPLLLLCLLSGPLFGAWIRGMELPEATAEGALQPCGGPAAPAAAQAAPAPAPAPADTAADTTPTPPPAPGAAAAAEAVLADIAAAFDRQASAYAPTRCRDARRLDNGPLLRTQLYRFDDGSLFTLHLRARPADGTPMPPLLVTSCPVQSRQSMLVLLGLLMVGVVVVLQRLRAGGRFLDFRNAVREPLRPGEVLMLIYGFTVVAGMALGLQFGSCAAADHRDAVRVEATQGPTLQDLMAPMQR